MHAALRLCISALRVRTSTGTPRLRVAGQLQRALPQPAVCHASRPRWTAVASGPHRTLTVCAARSCRGEGGTGVSDPGAPGNRDPSHAGDTGTGTTAESRTRRNSSSSSGSRTSRVWRRVSRLRLTTSSSRRRKWVASARATVSDLRRRAVVPYAPPSVDRHAGGSSSGGSRSVDEQVDALEAAGLEAARGDASAVDEGADSSSAGEGFRYASTSPEESDWSPEPQAPSPAQRVLEALRGQTRRVVRAAQRQRVAARRWRRQRQGDAAASDGDLLGVVGLGRRTAPHPLWARLAELLLTDTSALLALVTDASPAVLRDVLRCEDGANRSFVGLLVKQARTHKDAQTVVDVLTRRRLGDVSLDDRAAVLLALQNTGSRRNVVRSLAIRNVLLGTTGTQLTVLKGMGTGTGDTFDLQRLVYSDLAGADRDEVLQHIAVQAATVSRDEYPVQVVTDYDDTIQLNWLDRRFPRKTIYPGVAEFIQQLRMCGAPHAGAAPPSATEPGSARHTRRRASQVAQAMRASGGIVVLTARPAGVRSFVKNYTLRHLSWMDAVGNLTLLTGSLRHSTSIGSIVKKKFENFAQYRALFPEFRFVLLGDSGQGDAAVASLALDRYPDQVIAAFIHDVKPGLVTGDGGFKVQYKARGVVLFDTYVAAAAHAALVTVPPWPAVAAAEAGDNAPNGSAATTSETAVEASTPTLLTRHGVAAVANAAQATAAALKFGPSPADAGPGGVDTGSARRGGGRCVAHGRLGGGSGAGAATGGRRGERARCSCCGCAEGCPGIAVMCFV